MISNTILVGLVIISKVYAEPSNRIQDDQIHYKARVVHSKEKANRDKLVKIIENLNLNARNDVDQYERDKNYEQLQREKNPDNYSSKQDDEDEKVSSSSEPRIHIIRNPEVMEEFIENLRRVKTSSSSDDSSDDSDSSDNESGMRDDNTSIRRNAKFGINYLGSHGGRDDDELRIDTERTPYMPESLEDQVTPFKPHLEKSSEAETSPDDKLDSAKLYEGTHSKYVTKGFEHQDVWGVIKDQHDSREEKVDKARNYETNEVTTNIWEDVKKEMYSAKDKAYDYLKKKISKKNRYDGSAKTIWDERNDVTKKWVSVKPRNVNHKTKDLKRSRKQKATRDSVEIDWNVKKKDEFEDNQSSVKKMTVKIWDAPRTKKKNYEVWGQPKKVIDNDWDKVGREWSRNKDTWNEPRKTSRSSWKKKQRDVIYEKPSYVARIPEYHAERERGNIFQGRTPIPFIGRQGIYET